MCEIVQNNNYQVLYYLLYIKVSTLKSEVLFKQKEVTITNIIGYIVSLKESYYCTKKDFIPIKYVYTNLCQYK